MRPLQTTPITTPKRKDETVPARARAVPPAHADGTVVAVHEVEEADQEGGEEHADYGADGDVLVGAGGVSFVDYLLGGGGVW